MGDPITRDEMRDLLIEQAKVIQGGNSSAKPVATDGVGSGYVDNFTKKASDAAEALGPVVFGFKRLTEGSDVAQTALQGFGSVVNVLPGPLQSVGRLWVT